MLQLKKVYNALQIVPQKSNSKPSNPISIPLLQFSARSNSVLDHETVQNGPTLPADIWFMILPQVDYTDDCTLCKHKELYTISLVCRVFNDFATKALYQTLDLRVQDACREVHEHTLDTYEAGPSFLKESVLRKKLERLERTLRLLDGPALFIRHLKLPIIELCQWTDFTDTSYIIHPSIYSKERRNVYNYGKDEPSAQYNKQKAAQDDLPLYMCPLQRKMDLSSWKNNISAGILPKWITIFELASTRLESVSGLGSLWSYIYEYDRIALRERLCDVIEKNQNWKEWDWRWSSWGYSHPSVEAITVEPRLLEIFHKMKNVRSIKLDNEGWAVKVLGATPGPIESLTISSFNPEGCDFSVIFQHLPLEKLKSLRIIVTIKYFMEQAGASPFSPFIDYLKRCHEQSTSTLTNLDFKVNLNPISFGMIGGFGSPPRYIVPIEEFLLSVFTYAPFLRMFNLVLSTPHEDEIEYPKIHQSTSFTAQNLRTMRISLPSRNSKTWLASKISSNSFPALRRFSFRSAFSRNNGPKKICIRCKDKSWSELDKWYDFGKVQDRALIEACRESRIREWEMEILNLPWADCTCFMLEELLDNRRSIYFRPPQHLLTDRDSGLFFSTRCKSSRPQKDIATRRNARIIKTPNSNLTRGTVCDIFTPQLCRGYYKHWDISSWLTIISTERVGFGKIRTIESL